MEGWDIRLISVSYRRDGPQQEPVLQLYGRTREGKSLAAEYRGFKPYFFAVNPPQSLKGAFSRDSGVIGMEDVTLLVGAKETRCVKVTLQHPWETPDYRNRAKSSRNGPPAARCCSRVRASRRISRSATRST